MKIDITTLTYTEVIELRDQLNNLTKREQRSDNHKGRPAKIDWSTLDWNKSNRDLMIEHDLNPQLIGQWRRRLGHEKVTKHWPACKDWDWTKSSTEIAREKKTSVTVVNNYRSILGKPQAPYNRPYSSYTSTQKEGTVPFDWSTVDWMKPDVEIADQIKMTRERVRQKRAELGLPRRYKNDVLCERFLKAFEGAVELSWEHVVKTYPVTRSTFYGYCNKAGIKIRPYVKATIHPWHLMNFQIPNVMLEDIWNISAKMIAVRRSNHRLEKAIISPRRYKLAEEFKPLIEAEREKAKEWFAQKQKIIDTPVAVIENTQCL